MVFKIPNTEKGLLFQIPFSPRTTISTFCFIFWLLCYPSCFLCMKVLIKHRLNGCKTGILKLTGFAPSRIIKNVKLTPQWNVHPQSVMVSLYLWAQSFFYTVLQHSVSVLMAFDCIYNSSCEMTVLYNNAGYLIKNYFQNNKSSRGWSRCPDLPLIIHK